MSLRQLSWQHEHGFTLAEVMITVVLMGIVLGIATSTWFGLVESRRVDSATNQVAADLRLASTSATNRLASSYIVLKKNGTPVTCNGLQADYCLIRSTTSGLHAQARVLPDNDYSDSPPQRSIKLTSSNLTLDPAGISVPAVTPGSTSTVEFKSDGSAKTLSGTVGALLLTVRTFEDPTAPTLSCAVSHPDPCHDIEIAASTSRIKID